MYNHDYKTGIFLFKCLQRPMIYIKNIRKWSRLKPSPDKSYFVALLLSVLVLLKTKAWFILPANALRIWRYNPVFAKIFIRELPTTQPLRIVFCKFCDVVFAGSMNPALDSEQQVRHASVNHSFVNLFSSMLREGQNIWFA